MILFVKQNEQVKKLIFHSVTLSLEVTHSSNNYTNPNTNYRQYNIIGIESLRHERNGSHLSDIWLSKVKFKFEGVWVWIFKKNARKYFADAISCFSTCLMSESLPITL